GWGSARGVGGGGCRVMRGARDAGRQLTAAMEGGERVRPGSLGLVGCDLGELDDLPGLVKRVRQEVGPLWGLVNNAAVGFEGVLALMPTAQIEQLVRVNTVSPMVLTKYVVRGMLAAGGGRIVNVASIIGVTGYRGLSVYGATKASLLGFTRSLAREVGGLGVTVNAVPPGFLDTEMTQGLGGAQREQIVRRSALGRLADIEDVASAVEFLLGDQAKSITGTVLT